MERTADPHRMRPRPARPAAALVAVVALLAVLASCSGSGVASKESGERTSTEAGSAACAPSGSEKPAKALVRCGNERIALIRTDYATGTGVVVQVGSNHYVLTNLHVVDPFRSADVTLGAKELDDLAVVGGDAAADIALLGPVDDDLPTLAISDGTDVRKGDDVFAIGYPGENTDEDTELTVSSGIVSRLRKVPDFDQTYIQTDAKVADGQSGGPLFDDRGRILGITGLSYEGDFGLALIGEDVKAAAEGIADGTGDDLVTVPASADPVDGKAPEGGAGSGTVTLLDPLDAATLFLPPSAKPRTWTLTVPDAAGSVVVEAIEAVSGDTLATSASGRTVASQVVALVAARTKVDAAQLQAQIDEQLGLVDPGIAGRETSPGTYTVELKADEGAEINLVAPLATSPVQVAWASDQPLWSLTAPLGTTAASIGKEVGGILGGYDSAHDITVDLAAGQDVELWARSPQGDVALAVIPPGSTIDPVAAFDPDVAGIELFEDSDAGIYGYDVRERFTAKAAGTYRFRLTSSDGVPVAWKFTATDCADAGACSKS